MIEANRTTPHSRPDYEDADMDLPPPRVPQPGAGREALIHWLITIGGLTAMLLIGLMFTK